MRSATANGLTIKQAKFARKFAETGHASNSYRYAYDAENMSPQAIGVESSRLLDNPKVALKIQEIEDLRFKRHEVTVDKVVAEYSKLAFHDIRKAFDEEGNLKPIQQLDDDTAAAIAGIEHEELLEGRGGERQVVGRTRKIKLSDKRLALDSLAKHLGMFTEKVELTGANGGPVPIAIFDEILREVVNVGAPELPAAAENGT